MHTVTTSLKIALALCLFSLQAAQAASADKDHQNYPRCEKNHDAWIKRHNESLLALHDKLGLKPEQEEAWKKWISAFLFTDKDWEVHEQKKHEWEHLTALEKLERKLEHNKIDQVRLEAEIDATQRFQTILDDRQKQAFDQNFRLGKVKKVNDKDKH